MRHKIYKKVLSFCLAIIVAVAFSSGVPVYGNADGDSFYEDVVEVSDTSTILTRGNFLDYGTVLMSRKTPTRLLITGVTVAHIDCDKLGVGLYLERSSDGENYGSYRNWFFWKENAGMFSQTLELIVPSGYWYRLCGSHVAIVGEDGETTTTKTEGIYMPFF